MNGRRVLLFLSMLLVLTVSPPVTAASLGPISEETPPAVCDPGEFIRDIKCTGRYCDNISIGCLRVREAALGRAVWTSWVSEEGRGAMECPRNHFLAGLACRGRYCDNISLYCVEVANARTGACSRTGSVSEEGGGRLSFLSMIDKAGQQVAATGVKCSGRYCDNKSFTVCEISTR
jgi:hypothetical protein